jgi:peroxiredoxin family protein
VPGNRSNQKFRFTYCLFSAQQATSSKNARPINWLLVLYILCRQIVNIILGGSWGLSVLRKKKAPTIRKDWMGKMFGMMLPKSMESLTLSSMNFAGIGTRMMRGRMKHKNVDQLESMFAQARAAGVRMVACQMTMDLMGITPEELIEGVEIGGVARYMEAAASSNINLFV